MLSSFSSAAVTSLISLIIVVAAAAAAAAVIASATEDHVVLDRQAEVEGYSSEFPFEVWAEERESERHFSYYFFFW